MRLFLRKLTGWFERRRREEDLRAELQFHLDEEAAEREAAGLSAADAGWAARRDLGNTTLVREETRTVWTWTLLEQLGQDVRFALRTMRKHRAFTALAVLSLALGIGASTALYSFMDSLLLRSLPVPAPESLVVVNWHSKTFNFGPVPARGSGESEFVMHSLSGNVHDAPGGGSESPIFPFPAFERLGQESPEVFSSLFAYAPAPDLNVMIRGEAERADGQYVSGDFFEGLGVLPVSGRLLLDADDREGAPPVAVLSMGYSQRRFGGPATAAGQAILINNVPFRVVGVVPAEFFGVDPGAAPDVYLPLHTNLLFDNDADGEDIFRAPNYYWLQMMGRLRAGVTRAQAQAALAPRFERWVATTATTSGERANLPTLQLDEGAGGLDSLRRIYSKPLYVLLGMAGLILLIACANTANLLLARATARRQEMAVRLSIGAGRFRVVRQLLTESVVLASVSGALGVVIAVGGIRLLTLLLANGREKFTLHAELNWQVLLVTLALSLLCGILFGLAPAIQSARPALMPTLEGARGPQPRLAFARVLVAAQMAISLLLLVGAGLFVRTLSNLQAIPLGFDTDNVLLYELNAPQAGRTDAEALAFYGDVRNRVSQIPGVRGVTLSHASLIRAGRRLRVSVNGAPADPSTRILNTGPAFLSTMRIPLVMGREIEERDRLGAPSVAVVSSVFARIHFGAANPLGRRVTVGGGEPRELEVVGVAAEVKYGGIREKAPALVYIPYAMPPMRQMIYAVRTDGDPLRYLDAVRAVVHAADARVPVTKVKTQAAEIAQTINQEIVFARLCSAFALLALIIACVGLYGTMSYGVARRTSEIGLRMALGARRGTVVWMVLREVCLLAGVGLAISLPIALGASRLVESFLFDLRPNDPLALTLAVTILAASALLAGYGPARRASRIGPMIALRHE